MLYCLVPFFVHSDYAHTTSLFPASKARCSQTCHCTSELFRRLVKTDGWVLLPDFFILVCGSLKIAISPKFLSETIIVGLGTTLTILALNLILVPRSFKILFPSFHFILLGPLNSILFCVFISVWSFFPINFSCVLLCYLLLE